MIHVVRDGRTLCSWDWNYLQGKRNDKKVQVEDYDSATCSVCKREGKRLATSTPRATGTGGK